MKEETKMRILILALFAMSCVGLTGCDSASSAAPAPSTEIAAPGDSPRIAPNDPTDPAYSVFKNWGFSEDQMKLDFRAFRMNRTDEYILWDLYDDGYHGVSSHHRRRCRAEIKFEGTASEGTVTLSNARMAWRQDVTEPDIYCPGFGGVFEYRVTNQGLELGRHGEAPTLFAEDI